MLPLVAALVRLRSLWADVILWLPVFALCTPLGAPLFVSVTVVSGVSPQATRHRAYRERLLPRITVVCAGCGYCELGKIRLIRPIRPFLVVQALHFSRPAKGFHPLDPQPVRRAAGVSQLPRWAALVDIKHPLSAVALREGGCTRREPIFLLAHSCGYITR